MLFQKQIGITFIFVNFPLKSVALYPPHTCRALPIIKAIRIEKLAYQDECRRLLLGGLPWGQTQCEAPRAHSAPTPIGV